MAEVLTEEWKLNGWKGWPHEAWGPDENLQSETSTIWKSDAYLAIEKLLPKHFINPMPKLNYHNVIPQDRYCDNIAGMTTDF